MAQLLMEAKELGYELNNEECSLLFDVYEKKAIDRQLSWQQIWAIEVQAVGVEKQDAQELREKVEGELRDICTKMLVSIRKLATHNSA